MGRNIRLLLRRLIASGSLLLMGRRNLFRLASILNDAARLDGSNEMRLNGEELVQSVVLSAVPPHSTAAILDVGANIGEWTSRLRRRASQMGVAVQVHAFEPCSGTYEALVESVAAAGQGGAVTTVRKACSSRCGKAVLEVVADGSGVNTLVHGANRLPSRAESVDLITIDAFCQASRIESITLMKVDAEGHDLEVLRGAFGMFQSRAIGVAQFEYNQKWVYARAFLRDCFDYLHPLGYELGKVTRRGIEFYDSWSPLLENFREVNYIACTAPWKTHFKVLSPPWRKRSAP